MATCDFCNRVPCHSGQYCPSHYAVAVTCPPGFYCPTLTSKVECPHSSYCREGSAAPTECGWFTICPQSATCPVDFTMAAIMFATILLWAASYSLLFTVRDAGREFRESKRRARAEEIELIKCKKELLRLGSEGELNSMGPQVAMLRKSRNLNLGFRDLTVDISSGKSTKRIIDHISGDIRAGRLTAVMGPSGAGKSSFLHVIGGRLRDVGQGQSSVHISGSVLINGERRSMHSYRRVIGFVPQDDILHQNLSPKESFRLVSGLRLPDSYTYKQRKELVNNVLSLLDLEKIRHERIGDSSERGISGGQRKRVNIGIELVSDPWMLFLDEPTSGLDSASAVKVVSILRKLADLGLTVVCVLHQPRRTIFDMVDDVVLLGLGGRLVYSGPKRKAVSYFKTCGFGEVGDGNNPADWLTDVVAGDVKNRKNKSLSGSQDLQELWLAARQKRLERLSGVSSFTEDSEVLLDQVERRLNTEGVVVIKHPRWGNPQKRKLFLRKQGKEVFLVWTSEKGSKWGGFGFDGQVIERMSGIKEIREGITTTILERTGEPNKSKLYISLVLASRTLDLECESQEERDDLFLCLQQNLRVVAGRNGATLPPLEQNPVRSRSVSTAVKTVASDKDLASLVDILDFDSDDDEEEKGLSSGSWEGDDIFDEDPNNTSSGEIYGEFARGKSKRSSSMSPPPMVVQTSFGKQKVREGKKRSQSISPKEAFRRVARGVRRRFSVGRGRKKKRAENLLDPLSRSNPGLLVQVKHYLKISVSIQSARETSVDLSLMTLGGFVLGIVYSNVEESENELYSFAMASMSLGIMASTSVERYFPSEVQNFVRQTSSGTSATAYFLGKNVAHLPLIMVSPLFFSVFYVAFAAPRVRADELYIAFLGVVWACTGAGYALSMSFGGKAQLACTIYPLICTMFSGVNPSLVEMKENRIGVLSWLSYSRWSTAFMWLSQVDKMSPELFSDIHVKSTDIGYDAVGKAWCLTIMFIIGCIFRLLTWFLLRRIKRSHTGRGGKFYFM